MTKKQVKKAWIAFWKEKCVYTDIEPLTGMEVENPKHEKAFWKDFEKFLDREEAKNIDNDPMSKKERNYYNKLK